MQMYFHRRLTSSEERNRAVAVAACFGGNRASCAVARATLPSECAHRSVTVTFNVILIIRWGKKRIELKIKIRL
jgi:hypothetical protein